MKAKLGDTIVDIWEISIDEPAADHWVMEEFKKKQLAWSGQLVMSELEKQKLAERGLENEPVSPKQRAFSWILLHARPEAMADPFPYDVYLIVNQVRIPAYGQIGEYLVKLPDKSLAVYSKKKFEKELTLLDERPE